MSLSDSSSERSFNSEDSEANLAEVEDEQSDLPVRLFPLVNHHFLPALEGVEPVPVLRVQGQVLVCAFLW